MLSRKNILGRVHTIEECNGSIWWKSALDVEAWKWKSAMEEHSYNDRHEKSIGLIQVSADTVSILAFV